MKLGNYCIKSKGSNGKKEKEALGRLRKPPMPPPRKEATKKERMQKQARRDWQSRKQEGDG